MNIFGKSNKRQKPKANRRITPEERLARNITAPPRGETPRHRRSSKGHAKPLPTETNAPNGSKVRTTRIGQGFARAFAPIRHSLTGEWLGGPEVIRHLPFAGFIVLLMLGYTFLEYQYEYDERAIKEGRRELQNLRHHEQSLRGRFESQLQRSRLDEDMADIGLSAPVAPPTTLPATTHDSP